ncbi:bifunctional 3-demethylubiquinone-9 3-methyltransferase/ 2-octaprenyl-6-hydroxy phenol methylase [Caulifigura coniformis]|uniref:Bifunctional 3-demethylubiquinone-9 3-methyltransferase/ 2-octaprenyl-6-hydroxy phenol methylase n=1 Tax=Caulifigura coniformis TaxID=2527983 RepID=A0A517S9S1_9PLAN|nr:class I SAM-dependent methyltransferase [Caulifigura coniformis]QDT52887.1 bifunctional 3-demethylubiquinone-9 3-methyltransferase/ 2-octaprenyl-6-hydroxy phenol methylase [Caulifigura coniformis]
MSGSLTLRGMTPPFLWKTGLKLGRRFGFVEKFQYGKEQPAAYYDQRFDLSDHWKLHYTRSHYYPLWTVVADRLRRAKVRTILDIGCGPGQVACLLRDRGFENYTGLDFSPNRVKAAKDCCPTLNFVVADIFASTVLEEHPYDCVLTMEFLEHIERDLEVLSRIRPGTFVLATVPNFPAAGHVRHFRDVDEVCQRYESLFSSLEVYAILADEGGRRHFVMEGRRA